MKPILKNYWIPVFTGMTYIIKKPQAMISGATFFSVLFFRSYKEKYLAARRRNQYLKKNNDGYINWVAL